MARNLQGFFGGQPDCTRYSVKIIADSSSDTFEEIYLAGDRPFVVSYDTSSTPFDPARYSRASINVVADEKFFDAFSESPQGTKVVLTNEDSGITEWVGYLTSNLLNMPEDSCGAETFTLEAQDCLSTLENYDYKTIGSGKSIVSLGQIVASIARRCGQIKTLYMDNTLRTAGGAAFSLNSLTISEQNFFSSDTDDPWNMREVLEEICRYLGFTAIQYRDNLYLYDIQSHAGDTWQSDSGTAFQLDCYMATSAGSFTNLTQGTYSGLGKGATLSQALFRGTGADISLETLYNKIVVKDSFYEIDHFIPDFYEDTYLTNRQGDFWKCSSISKTGQFKYINSKGKSKKEEKDEGDYIHYIRKFDHRDYDSIYRDKSNINNIISNFSKIKVSEVQQTQNDNYTAYSGIYSVGAKFTNTDSVSHTIKVYATLRYDWFDGDTSTPDSDTNTSSSQSVSIGAGQSATITASVITTHHERYSFTSTYDSYYTLDGSSTHNPLSNQNDSTSQYVGATIVDVADFDKPMDTSQYNYETEASINFDRYIMVHQCDQPLPMHPYATYYIENDQLHGGNALTDSAIENYFPIIMKMRDGYNNPMIINDNAYLSLDASAIFERYDVEYMNADWTEENSVAKHGGLGLFKPDARTVTKTPCLVFKLRVGNKYWSSRSNSWTTTEGAFVVNLGTDKTDSDEVDWTGWWNKEHPVLNNVEWTDWAGAKGYKIPLNTSLDFTGGIEFDILMPSKMQDINDPDPYDGMNNYCWIKDLKIEFTTKDRENYDLADVAYENIINSGAVNTLSEITCKLTTYPDNGQHSYSNVALNGVLLNTMKKVGLDGVANKCEENIIKAYANQYSTPTIRQDMTLDVSITPFSKIKDPILNKYFAVLGSEIDYGKGSQRLTLIETKTWNLQ